MSESDKKSPPRGWTSWEHHDKVKAELVAQIQKGTPNWTYGRTPNKVGASGICDCCGSAYNLPEYHSAAQKIVVGHIRREDPIPYLGDRKHFVIRDNDGNDLLISWSDR